MFLSAPWSVDSSTLRECLDRLRLALDRPFSVAASSAVGYDRQEISKSLRLIFDKLDNVDLVARRALSGLVEEFRPASQLDDLRDLFDALQAGWQKRVARILGEAKLATLARLLAAPTPDLLRILGREDDENSHSDLIAWLLSPTRAPNIAHLALRHLTAPLDDAEEWHAAIDAAAAHDLISVRREMLIGRELASSDDLCRVDIVLSGPGFVLAIENKVWSREHSDQTSTYWKWLEPMRCLRSGVFLSPSGLTATCPQFRPVSYLDLVSSLLEGPTTSTISSAEEIVLASYLKTLARYIVPVQINAALEAARTKEEE